MIEELIYSPNEASAKDLAVRVWACYVAKWLQLAFPSCKWLCGDRWRRTWSGAPDYESLHVLEITTSDWLNSFSLTEDRFKSARCLTSAPSDNSMPLSKYNFHLHFATDVVEPPSPYILRIPKKETFESMPDTDPAPSMSGDTNQNGDNLRKQPSKASRQRFKPQLSCTFCRNRKYPPLFPSTLRLEWHHRSWMHESEVPFRYPCAVNNELVYK